MLPSEQGTLNEKLIDDRLDGGVRCQHSCKRNVHQLTDRNIASG